MRITLEIGNLSKGKALLSFLKTLGYITAIRVDEEKPLTDKDWVLPGRKATEKEFEMLAEAMENDPRGDNMDVVFKRLHKKYPK